MKLLHHRCLRNADTACSESNNGTKRLGDDFGRWRRFFSLTEHFLLYFHKRMQVLLSQKIVSIVQNRLELQKSTYSIYTLAGRISETMHRHGVPGMLHFFNVPGTRKIREKKIVFENARFRYNKVDGGVC